MNNKNHWDKVYANNSADNVSWYQKEPVISLELIQRAGINKNSQIIDVGGGTSVLADNLINFGYKNIWINDISEIALKITQERLADKSVTVSFTTGDITQLNFETKFDLWHDRAVFHFLTDAADRINYVNVMEESVKQGGYVIISTFAIDGPTKCSGLEVEQYDAEKIMTSLGNGFKLLEEREEIHITPAGKEQRFNYFTLLRI